MKIPKRPRKIRATLAQEIGEGCSGRVFRISPRRVVKIFFGDPPEQKDLVLDEIEGSKLSKHALPILEIVKVKVRNRTMLGIIKRYIPHDVEEEEASTLRQQLYEETDELSWDCYSDNVKKDSRGRLWLIDTQTEAFL